MKLDATLLRFLDDEHFRVLTAIEMGMKNHELVPIPLIERIAGLRCGGTKKRLSMLLKYKLVVHENNMYDGYKLTYLGYDFLALKTFSKRNKIAGVGNKLGVGKEADIYIVIDDEGNEMILKLHRLGRTSFTNITNKRDYFRRKGKRGGASWLYLSRLAAMKEFAFMRALHEEGFPVPTPLDQNRHCILMSRIKGTTLANIRPHSIKFPDKAYQTCLRLITKMATYGLIHGDFNEFNIMIESYTGPDGELTGEDVHFIDFPQMTSTDHLNADVFFERDINCIHLFFTKKLNCLPYNYRPTLGDSDVKRLYSLDHILKASGWTPEVENEFNSLKVDEKDEDEDGEEHEPQELADDGAADESTEVPTPVVSARSTEVSNAQVEARGSTEVSKARGSTELPTSAISTLGSTEVPTSAIGSTEVSNAQVEAQESTEIPDLEEHGEVTSDAGEGRATLETSTTTLVLNRMTGDHIKKRVQKKLTNESERQFQKKLGNGRNMTKGKQKRKIANEVRHTIIDLA